MNISHNNKLELFHFNYGAYPGPHYSLNYNLGKFEYRCIAGFETETKLINPVLNKKTNWENNKFQINSNDEDLNIPYEDVTIFLNYLKRYCFHWSNKYELGPKPICDGPIWEIKVKTGAFSFKSEGHIVSPGNFKTFLHKLELLTGKIFEP